MLWCRAAKRTLFGGYLAESGLVHTADSGMLEDRSKGW